jgi:hypothetical protein
MRLYDMISTVFCILHFKEGAMDQAKVVIKLNEGIIELEGPVEFVEQYLEKYGSAIKGLSTIEPERASPPRTVRARGKARGGQRSCTRAIRAEIKAGFFDEAKSTRAVKERLTEKGVSCSSGLLRTSLKKVVDAGRLSPSGRGRARVYNRTGEQSVALPSTESSE